MHSKIMGKLIDIAYSHLYLFFPTAIIYMFKNMQNKSKEKQ